jgi:CBS domain-containing protein
MKVDAILKEKGGRVVTVRPDTSIDTVIRRMKLDRIGAVVVSADGETIAGILSERDILYGLVEHGIALLGLKAADVMTHEVLTCSREDSVQSIMHRMTHRRVRHLPVIENGRLCGMISIGDAVKHRLGEVELEANVLRDAYLAVR